MRRRLSVFVLAVVTLASGAPWAAPLAVEVVPLDAPPEAKAETAERRPGMLPDGVVVRARGIIRAAWLTGPTRRYRHGVLGDAIEASGLAAETADKRVLTIALGPDAVFEDRYPRPHDLDGDGNDELLLVKSTFDGGAALVVAGLRDGKLALLAESAPIGLARRWLNPVGAADFDGDGRIETAHVETPHIGGVLVISRRDGSRLSTLHRVAGFSNHQIGSRELRLSAIFDADGDGTPDLLVPDASRRSLRIVGFSGGRFRELARVPFRASVARVSVPDEAVFRRNRRLAVIVHLSDGRAAGLAF